MSASKYKLGHHDIGRLLTMPGAEVKATLYPDKIPKLTRARVITALHAGYSSGRGVVNKTVEGLAEHLNIPYVSVGPWGVSYGNLPANSPWRKALLEMVTPRYVAMTLANLPGDKYDIQRAAETIEALKSKPAGYIQIREQGTDEKVAILAAKCCKDKAYLAAVTPLITWLENGTPIDLTPERVA